MKKIIQSISEAYSIQPGTLYVGLNLNGSVITEIKLSIIYVDGDPFEYYIAIDNENNTIAEFPKGSVSVFYKMVEI